MVEAEIFHTADLSDATLGVMAVSNARPMRERDAENTKLKQLMAAAHLGLLPIL